jgi:tetratricopeptide (TPR) repeat protein
MTDQSEKRELAQEFWRWLHFEKEHFNASLWELLEKLNGLWLQGKIGVTQRLYELFVELLQTQRTLNDPQVNLTYIEGVLDAHRGAFHWAARKFNEAELFFRSSAQHFADSGFGHYNASVVQMALGDMLEQRGRFNEALKAYQRGLHCSEFWSTPKCDALRQEIM